VLMIRSVEAKALDDDFKGIANSYLLEYSVDSSRGQNHYDVLATIANKKLYVMTVQFREDEANIHREDAYAILSSLRIE
jgi:predicted transposase YbfD/YdcC